jgi:chorismate--pyruvate lyase
MRVWEREVLLRCDGAPVVYGHTVVPMSATAQDWPLFSALGERSLGTTLFYDPLVGAANSNLPGSARATPCWRACMRRSAGRAWACHPRPSYYARRCVYRRRQGLLLVTEVFLPAVLNLAAAESNMNVK